MTNPSFSEELLRTINEKHISPKPKWEFLMKDWAIWTAGAISILIGGLAIGIIITLVRTDDVTVLQETNRLGTNLFLVLFPYFWILILIGFLVLAGFYLKHTKRGYRLTLPMYAAISVSLSIVLGICFYDAGFGQMIDSLLTNKPGRLLEFVHPRAVLWDRPMSGMLGGIVLAAQDERTFVLRDFSNQVWLVRVTDPRFDTNRMPPHARVRCLGSQTGDMEFTADRVMPWGSRKTILIPLPPPPSQQYFEFRVGE